MPEYVLDYVLLHELAHLLVPSHGPNFWMLLDVYPRTERARGFLEGFASAGGGNMPGDVDDVDDVDGVNDVNDVDNVD
jgi:hypothetical protein